VAAVGEGVVIILPPATPVITEQPQSQTVEAGQTVTFTVGATGAGPLTYTWQVQQGDTNSPWNDTCCTPNGNRRCCNFVASVVQFVAHPEDAGRYRRC
jgi:hypothetical protein